MSEPFVFFTERRLVALTGLRARTLPELLTHLYEVPGSSIFYHTHQQYLSHHFEKPTFYNDFSVWASNALQEEQLAEKLASIDLLAFTSIRHLREAIIAIIEGYARTARPRECPPGAEFHFCKSKSFIMPTGVVAQDVPDFFEKLPHVTNISFYFHFFEARLRLERRTNDFSQWLTASGHEPLAAAIDRLNPYEMTLDELKNDVIQLGKKQRRKAQRG